MVKLNKVRHSVIIQGDQCLPILEATVKKSNEPHFKDESYCDSLLVSPKSNSLTNSVYVSVILPVEVIIEEAKTEESTLVMKNWIWR